MVNVQLNDKIILTFVDDRTPRIDGCNRPFNLTLGQTYELVSYNDGMVTVINDKGKKARYIPSRFTFSVYIDTKTLEYRNSSARTQSIPLCNGLLFPIS